MKRIKQIILILFLLLVAIFLGPSIVKANVFEDKFSSSYNPMITTEELCNMVDNYTDDYTSADPENFLNVSISPTHVVDSDGVNIGLRYVTWDRFLCIDHFQDVCDKSVVIKNVIDVYLSKGVTRIRSKSSVSDVTFSCVNGIWADANGNNASNSAELNRMVAIAEELYLAKSAGETRRGL